MYHFATLYHFASRGRIQLVGLGEAISVIIGSQVSVGSQVLFRIVQNHVKKCYFRNFFWGGRSPQSPLLDPPLLQVNITISGIQIYLRTHMCSCLSRRASFCLNTHLFRWTLPTLAICLPWKKILRRSFLCLNSMD